MAEGEGVIASYQFEVVCDHSQFWLEDCGLEESDEDAEFLVRGLDLLYNDAATARHLGVTPGRLCVLTATFYGTIPVEFVLRADAPEDDFVGWDNVAEASLEVASGCIVAYGPETHPSERPSIEMSPGAYRARVYTGGVETVDEITQHGQEYYRVVLWPTHYQAPALLHSGTAY